MLVQVIEDLKATFGTSWRVADLRGLVVVPFSVFRREGFSKCSP